ncbi:MAG: hypothetical protein ABR562_04255, partial [Thermoplasmatota archaeon]
MALKMDSMPWGASRGERRPASKAGPRVGVASRAASEASAMAGAQVAAESTTTEPPMKPMKPNRRGLRNLCNLWNLWTINGSPVILP